MVKTKRQQGTASLSILAALSRIQKADNIGVLIETKEMFHFSKDDE